MSDFEKLNRLRTLAGRNPLKSWKGSKEALSQQISRLEEDGFQDPGAPADNKPPVDFGPDAKADTPPSSSDIPSLKDSALMKNIGKPAATDIGDAKVNKHPAKLARGTDTESHCKKAVADARRAERKAKPKMTKEEKKAAKKAAKKARKASIEFQKDGTAIKTTTAGNERRLGKDLADRIKKAKENKGKQVDPDNFTVAELARELDIDPKVARAKLRRHKDKIEKLHSKGQEGWTFPNKAKPELTKILQP